MAQSMRMSCSHRLHLCHILVLTVGSVLLTPACRAQSHDGPASYTRAVQRLGNAPRTLSSVSANARLLIVSDMIVSDTVQLRPHDSWLGFDKVQHFTFSFLWTLGGQYTLVNKDSWSEGDALPASIGVSAALGLGKELYDWRVGPTQYFSRKDLVVDGMGILAATVLILL